MSTDRNTSLAKIHIARKQLDLDDATYRDILWKVARVRSSKDLDAGGRLAVLQHFQSLGWRARKPKAAVDPDAPHNLGNSKQLQRIDWLLKKRGRRWNYVRGMVKRITGKERVEFCAPADLSKLIAALEIDGRRHRGGERR